MQAMQNAKTLLIANPAAKRGHGEAAARYALRAFRERLGAFSLDIAYTTSPEQGITLAANAQGYQAVLALGGDGIAHEVVNGLMQIPEEDRPIFGLLPVGSGNDYARSLGMSRKLEQAVEQLLEPDVRSVDVGSCNGVFFDETVSFGLDAAIAIGTVPLREKLHISGAPLYLASGINQLVNHLDTYHFRAVLDDARELSGEMAMFAVQLGPTYGGGFRVCPDASIDDGVFDICWAEPARLPKAAYVFLRAKNAGHLASRVIHTARCSSLHIEFDKRPPAQADGEELVGGPFDIRMHPRALRVFVPKSGS